MPACCPSLTADAMRSDDETRIAYEADLQNLAAAIADGMPGKAASDRAWTLLALFAGGSALARAVKDEKVRARSSIRYGIPPSSSAKSASRRP